MDKVTIRFTREEIIQLNKLAKESGNESLSKYLDEKLSFFLEGDASPRKKTA